MPKHLGPAFVALVALIAAGVTATPSYAQTETIVASDSFNRADENPFAITGNWGRTIAGNYDGFSQLSGSRVISGTNEGIYYWKGAGSFTNTTQFARETVLDSTGEPALILLGGADHALLVSWGPPGPGANKIIYFYWYKNGADQGILATEPCPLADGDVIEAVLAGGTITAKVNGVVIRSIPNTTTLTSGTPGFMTYANPTLPQFVTGIDDWQAGTPPSYSISGTIQEFGVGLSDVLVTASGGFTGSTTTDANGAYTLAGVTPNATSIVLTPTRPGHTMTPTSLTVAGPMTANVTGQDFTSTIPTTAVLTTIATHGTITRAPDLSPYPIGTQVTLTPVPDGGYTFLGWGGDVPPGHLGDNPLVVVMDQDRTISAAFSSSSAIADDFNRANETPLAVGGNWAQSFGGGTVNLVGNQVVGAANDALYFWQGAGVFENNRQFARARVTHAGGQVGVVLLGGVGQGLITAWNQGTLYVYWYSGGSYRGNLTTLPSALQDGDLIEAELSNGTVAAKINGVIVLSVANTTTLTSGKPGFEMFATGGGLDDWEAGTPFSYSISGTIIENGSGLIDVLVTASGGFTGSTTTGASGAYTLGGVPANAISIVLTPTRPGHAFTPATLAVAGPVTADVTGQDFASTISTTATLATIATHGTITRDPDLSSYPIGTQVTLSPVPDDGYTFLGWSGDVPAGHLADNPLVVTMDQDRTISAAFASASAIASDAFNRANETPLAVGGNWGQSFGGGTVNLVGNQIVGAANDGIYYWQGAGVFENDRQFARARVTDAGGQVGLVLLGGAGQGLIFAWNQGTLFIYWYSGGSYRGNLTTLPSTLQDGDLIEAELSNGTLTAKINGTVVLSIANTTTLTSGTPGFETFSTGGALDDWEAGTPFSYTISGTITENGSGLAGVVVNASGGFTGSTTTGASGAYTLVSVPPNATSIVLTPTADGHAMTPLTRTVNGPVTANVTGQDFISTPATDATLTTPQSHGTVQRSPDQATYLLGTEVTLTALPDSGYTFSRWTGNLPAYNENDNPLQVTMDQNRTITAQFLRPLVTSAEYFDRPNEVPFVVGGSWAQPIGGGNVNLVGNQISGGGGEALYYWQGPGMFENAQQFARARVVNPNGQLGLVLLGGPGQALVAAWNNGTLFVYWYSGGTYQGNLTTLASTVAAGDIVEAQLVAGNIRVKINGVLVLSLANNTTLTSGQPGFETFQTGGAIDDWEAGTMAAYPVDVFPYMTH